MEGNIPKSSVVSLKETAKEWAKKINIDSVDKLNNMVRSGKTLELILVCEAMQQNAIYEIAGNIVKHNKRIVLIAGPSSAGKTTFSHRLSIQLRAMGMKPHAIAADNYFVNREDNPKDENGNFDFECIDAMDIKTLNEDMVKLLEGQCIEMPEFNFKTGRREYHGHYLKIEKNDVIIMEGIHSLNPKMTYMLDKDDKFKLYISPLNQLYIDEETKVSTMDSRLLRRMVRDNRTRGNNVEKTLSMWKSVRCGEEKNIFPYEIEADAMFNSGLLYEYTAIKPYVVPLLENIPETSSYYSDVERLKIFINRFEEIDSQYIPLNSILREFIGGGCFNV
ncbi:MAG: nucleoside kinase [Coprococcus sp.]